MKIKVFRATILLCAILLVTACASRTSLQGEPTATPSKPSGTVKLPTGRPTTSWGDIPIMPNAIAAEESTSNGKPKSYDYTIEADIATVETFYAKELSQRGWVQTNNWASLLESDNGTSMFIKGKDKGKVTDLVGVSVITVNKAENLALVTLTK